MILIYILFRCVPEVLPGGWTCWPCVDRVKVSTGLCSCRSTCTNYQVGHFTFYSGGETFVSKISGFTGLENWETRQSEVNCTSVFNPFLEGYWEEEKYFEFLMCNRMLFSNLNLNSIVPVMSHRFDLFILAGKPKLKFSLHLNRYCYFSKYFKTFFTWKN